MIQTIETGGGGSGSSEKIDHSREHDNSGRSDEREHDQNDFELDRQTRPHEFETVVIDYRNRYHDNSHATQWVEDKHGRTGSPATLVDPKSRYLISLYLQQATTPTPSWCGSGATEAFTPELFPESCMYHDLCYETPGVSRFTCDFALLQNSLREHPSFGKAGWAFFIAVRLGGRKPYEDAQNSSREQQRRWPRNAQ